MNRTIFLTVWLLSCLAAFAQSTVHIYSPWAADPLKVTYRHHLYGGATGYAASADTKMTDEGAGWFSFSWPAGRTFSWEAITLRNCETSTDQNCNGGVYWVGGGNNVEIKMTTLFANQSEVWLYPIAGSPYYRIDFDPPGTKYVWFKSPWGNHSLPNMVAGADTVPMRFVGGDADHCGWFLGAFARLSSAVSIFSAHTPIGLCPHQAPWIFPLCLRQRTRHTLMERWNHWWHLPMLELRALASTRRGWCMYYTLGSMTRIAVPIRFM